MDLNSLFPPVDELETRTGPEASLMMARTFGNEFNRLADKFEASSMDPDDESCKDIGRELMEFLYALGVEFGPSISFEELFGTMGSPDDNPDAGYPPVIRDENGNAIDVG